MTDDIRDRYWYHTINLPSGVTTPGEYDHRPYLARYRFPESLEGLSVLDVGAADGFFSFEFERRGAKRVVALDYNQGYPDVPYHEIARFGEGTRASGVSRFELAKERLGSSVEHVDQDLYTLDRATVGAFDFVFCGSVLLHLKDPFRALAAIRRVAAGRVVIATAVYDEPLARAYEAVLGWGMRLAKRRTAVRIAALVQTEMDDSYWLPTPAALVNMVERSGFARPRIVSRFALRRADGRRGWSHAVIHATVEGDANARP